MQSNKLFLAEYRLKAGFVMVAALLIILYRLLSSALLTGMEQPPFLFAEKEVVYRIFLQSGIPQLVSANPFVSIVFDIDLLVLPIFFMITLNRVYVILFSILVIFYFLTYNIVTGHHYHSLVGLMVITFPFWFKNEEKFNLAWDAARYYFLYIFASAALWKIMRGSVFYPDQLSNILRSQQINLLLFGPDSFQSRMVKYLIANPQISHMVLIVNVSVQLCFAVGFITKRFDTFLFWLVIIFCTGNYLVMGINSTELLILSLTLLDWGKIQSCLQSKTFLNFLFGNLKFR